MILFENLSIAKAEMFIRGFKMVMFDTGCYLSKFLKKGKTYLKLVVFYRIGLSDVTLIEQGKRKKVR